MSLSIPLLGKRHQALGRKFFRTVQAPRSSINRHDSCPLQYPVRTVFISQAMFAAELLFFSKAALGVAVMLVTSVKFQIDGNSG